MHEIGKIIIKLMNGTKKKKKNMIKWKHRVKKNFDQTEYNIGIALIMNKPNHGIGKILNKLKTGIGKILINRIIGIKRNEQTQYNLANFNYDMQVILY